MSDLILVEVLPMDRNPAAVYLSGLSKSGRATMEKSLSQIAEWITGQPDPFAVDWAALRYQHVNAIKTRMIDDPGYSPSTTNKYLSAVRGVLKSAWNLDLIPTEDYHRAVSVEGLKVDNLPAGRALSIGEITALISVCENDPGPAGARDAALIALLYAAGLRRSEIVSLDLADYNPEDGSLVVTGKGNKQRIVYVLNGSSRAMNDWLKVRGEFAGPLFVPILKSGHITDRRMTDQAIYNMLRKRADQAKVPDFSPHDLRRTFISSMLDQGNDLSVVADLAGHKNVSTTARYDRRGEAAKRSAADKLFIPYGGRKSD